MLPYYGCPTILILVSKVGMDRKDSLGIGTVVFCVLSGWYSSTRQRDSSTVALDTNNEYCTHSYVTKTKKVLRRGLEKERTELGSSIGNI